jgi:hypothetical protein
VFAAFNIIVSFLWGLVPIRLILQRGVLLKFAGLISLVAYFALALVLNLALAHLREIPPDLQIDVDREALRRLLASPFGLTDIQSWLLFGIGFVFSIGAMVDGLLFFDPIIGYTGLERRWMAASKRFTDAKEHLIESLRDIRDDAADAMNTAARDLTVRRSAFEDLLTARGRLSQRFVEHQSQIERGCNTLLTAYREANRGARSTTAPSYFDQRYSMDRIAIDASGPGAEQREHLNRSIVEIQNLLKGQVEAIYQSFDKAVSSYREIDEFFPEADRGKP